MGQRTTGVIGCTVSAYGSGTAAGQTIIVVLIIEIIRTI